MLHKCIIPHHQCINAQSQQHTALLFQIAICRLWRQTPLIKAVFHPASYTCTVDRSLSGIRYVVYIISGRTGKVESS